MIVGIEKLYRCPICRNTGGEIAVDLLGLVLPRPDRSRFIFAQADEDDRHLLVFGRDLSRERPCAHLATFYISGMVSDSGSRRRHFRDFEIEFDHPWFDTQDPECRVIEHIWDRLNEGQPLPAPLPYELGIATWSRQIPGSSMTFELHGIFVATNDVPEFLDSYKATMLKAVSARNGRKATKDRLPRVKV